MRTCEFAATLSSVQREIGSSEGLCEQTFVRTPNRYLNDLVWAIYPHVESVVSEVATSICLKNPLLNSTFFHPHITTWSRHRSAFAQAVVIASINMLPIECLASCFFTKELRCLFLPSQTSAPSVLANR